MRVLVTGSRDWQTRATVWMALHTEAIRALGRTCAGEGDGTLTVVNGRCRTGADHFAHVWVEAASSPAGAYTWSPLTIVEDPHPAKWRKYGKAAGIIRNVEMVELGADLCLAFIRNHSRGASHTASLAEAAGIPTQRFVE